MSTLVNYHSIDREILDLLDTTEDNIRQISENDLFIGTTTYNGLVPNLQSAYNFSNIYVYPIYNLQAALKHFLQLPEIAHNFIIYKIRGRQPKLLYHSPEAPETEWVELTEEDAEFELSPEIIEIEETDDRAIGLNPIITIDNLILSCVVRIPDESFIDVSAVNYSNFQIQLNESDEVHYYKYNIQNANFEEIIVNRETQLGKGILDIYLDMDEQAADLDSVASLIQNRRGIVAESRNGQPILQDSELHDLNITFDTGSLWFIKEPIMR